MYAATPAHPAPHVSGRARRLRTNGGRLLAGVSVAVIGVVAGGVPFAAAKDATMKISLVAIQQKDLRLPAGGVEVDSDQTLAGKAVGTDSLNCTNNGPLRSPSCIATIALPAGDIVSLLIPKDQPTTGGPIIAGTGSFAKVTGTVYGTNITATKTDVVITLHHH